MDREVQQCRVFPLSLQNVNINKSWRVGISSEVFDLSKRLHICNFITTQTTMGQPSYFIMMFDFSAYIIKQMQQQVATSLVAEW